MSIGRISFGVNISAAKRREKMKENKTDGDSSGLVTLLNSRHANVAPGLSTRYASLRTSGIDVQFLIPNAMV
jgi:hypothetical protein